MVVQFPGDSTLQIITSPREKRIVSPARQRRSEYFLFTIVPTRLLLANGGDGDVLCVSQNEFPHLHRNLAQRKAGEQITGHFLR